MSDPSTTPREESLVTRIEDEKSHPLAWKTVITSLLAGNAITLIVPGGAAVGAAVQFRMLAASGRDTDSTVGGQPVIPARRDRPGETVTRDEVRASGGHALAGQQRGGRPAVFQRAAPCAPVRRPAYRSHISHGLGVWHRICVY